ncbi:MAG: HAMP domain-containing sensor histidine kinase [Thermomonas sp.]
MYPRLQSTSTRLVLAVSATFLATFLLLGAGIYSAVLASLDHDTREFVQSDAAELLVLRQRAGIPALLAEVHARVADQDDADLLYAVVDSSGRVVAGANVGATVVRRAGWIRFRDPVDPGHPRVLAKVVAIDPGQWLVAGMRLRAEDGFLAIMQRSVWLALALAAVLGLLVGWLTSRWVGSRLRQLDDTARRIAAGEIGLRVPADGSGDPFDRVGARLNAMLDRIDALMDGVREATDHIAHDLHTPLTRLRQRLEVLRAIKADQTTPTLIDAAILETDALLQTFAALLRLSRIEGQGPTIGSAVDLAGIASDAVELYAPNVVAIGMRIDIDAEPAILAGDTDQLFQVVVNLLDNAMKYAVAGAGIRVRTCTTQEGVSLEVSDRGPGIPAGEHARVFDRFQRLEQHRGTPGNGLGLSLVRAIAARHGGRVELHDHQPGLRVIVIFPVMPDQGVAS